MSPRHRSPSRRNLPAHLHERNGYYSWRNPVDGREYGLGRDRQAAIAQAIEANQHIEGQRREARLVDRLSGDGDRTLGKWLEVYAGILAKRDLAANTRASYKSLGKRAGELLGRDAPIARISALDVSNALAALAASGKERWAQAMRSWLTDCFREAYVAGWIAENPVRATKGTRVTVKRTRLTLDDFRAIYARVDVPWLRNAMALALVSAQRREDIALATFAAVHDDAWWVTQTKTGTRLCLPLALRLNVFGMSLGDVVKQCRQTRILSKHLVHQTDPRGNSPVGAPIWKDTISRRFSEAVTALGRDWGDKEPPTFHEIRSLSERLYAAQGTVNTQELLGHKDARTTGLYHDSRGAEWVRVRVTG